MYWLLMKVLVTVLSSDHHVLVNVIGISDLEMTEQSMAGAMVRKSAFLKIVRSPAPVAGTGFQQLLIKTVV